MNYLTVFKHFVSIFSLILNAIDPLFHWTYFFIVCWTLLPNILWSTLYSYQLSHFAVKCQWKAYIYLYHVLWKVVAFDISPVHYCLSLLWYDEQCFVGPSVILSTSQQSITLYWNVFVNFTAYVLDQSHGLHLLRGSVWGCWYQ